MTDSDQRQSAPKDMITGFPPVVPIVGYSGSGKTTVLVELIAELTGRGFRVGTIKHHSHDFQMDVPGKDTWRHKQAGALSTIISSPSRVGMVRDVTTEMPLEELISLVSGVDVIMVEGYKRVKRPKIEVFRADISDEPACGADENLVGLITDSPIDSGVPRFSPHDISAIADFIITRFSLTR